MASPREVELNRAGDRLVVDERQALLEKAATLKGVFNSKEYALSWTDTSGETSYFLRAVVPRAKAYMEYALKIQVGEMPVSTLRFTEISADIRAAEGPVCDEAARITSHQMEQIHLRSIVSHALGSCVLECYESSTAEHISDDQ